MADNKNKRSKRLFVVKFDATYVFKLFVQLIAFAVLLGIILVCL